MNEKQKFEIYLCAIFLAHIYFFTTKCHALEVTFITRQINGDIFTLESKYYQYYYYYYRLPGIFFGWRHTNFLHEIFTSIEDLRAKYEYNTYLEEK